MIIKNNRKKLLIQTKIKKKKGVLFLYNISINYFYMQIKKHLSEFGEISRIFFLKGKSKKNCCILKNKIAIGWVEFLDKKNAKQASEYFKKKKFLSLVANNFKAEYLKAFDWEELSLYFLKKK